MGELLRNGGTLKRFAFEHQQFRLLENCIHPIFGRVDRRLPAAAKTFLIAGEDQLDFRTALVD